MASITKTRLSAARVKALRASSLLLNIAFSQSTGMPRSMHIIVRRK